MGREGGLPRAFAWTHPRFRTPWVGIVFSLVVTLLLGVFFAHHYGPITYFIWMATSRDDRDPDHVHPGRASPGSPSSRSDRDGLEPCCSTSSCRAGAIAICGYTLYKSIHPTPAYTGIVKWAPWVALIWLALGVASTSWLTLTKPDRVRAFGTILGAGEGVPSDAGDAARDRPRNSTAGTGRFLDRQCRSVRSPQISKMRSRRAPLRASASGRCRRSSSTAGSPTSSARASPASGAAASPRPCAGSAAARRPVETTGREARGRRRAAA